MNKYARYLGMLLIVFGALMLVATRLHVLYNNNALLIGGLLCIVAGICWHVHSIKKESLY